VPTLGNRVEDIPVLAKHFLTRYSRSASAPQQFTEDALQKLMQYHWPGNVRELENTIKRLTVLSTDIKISPDLLYVHAPYLKGIKTTQEIALNEIIKNKILELLNSPQELPDDGIYNFVLRKFEKPLIEETLKISKGNKKRAAQILGINRNTLSKKINELGIEQDESII
jgi:two-component system nitrogen regulation response regulator GlnG